MTSAWSISASKASRWSFSARRPERAPGAFRFGSEAGLINLHTKIVSRYETVDEDGNELIGETSTSWSFVGAGLRLTYEDEVEKAVQDHRDRLATQIVPRLGVELVVIEDQVVWRTSVGEGHAVGHARATTTGDIDSDRLDLIILDL